MYIPSKHIDMSFVYCGFILLIYNLIPIPGKIKCVCVCCFKHSGSDFLLPVHQASVRHLPFKRHSSYPRLQDDPWIFNARKTVERACSRYGQASAEHKVSLINLDEVYTRCAEEFAQNTIDDIEKLTLECRSAEA